MTLSLRQIRYLVEVGRLGGIQAASRSLNISQSSIVAALQRADETLGARIFERRPARGVTATPAGERFLTAARALMSAHEDFERQVDAFSTNPPQSVRIGCFAPFGSLFMAPVLRRYLDKVGDVEIALLEGDQRQLTDWLARSLVDLVVTYDTGPAFAQAERICSVPPHVALPASDPLAATPVIDMADLVTRPFVLLDLPETASFLLGAFEGLERPRVALRSRNYDTVRNAVAAGLGFTILHLRPFCDGALDPPSLVRRPIRNTQPNLQLVVADIYQSLKPSFVATFIDVLRAVFDEAGSETFGFSRVDDPGKAPPSQGACPPSRETQPESNGATTC
jgi:DNA-binding transcriptional LysR family regulator